ncbi:hypothetical protein DMB66_45480 [Actinoplanes sp. ATCC 53533]|uniref:hypothetical protein n=1 Tax=Actinoplanes sp. ATCC 53533 TaxID=1288362 RepID=UPI000F787E00|nr:hypothetical protein [Actinoplanes sp. ATCC 53533]RSM48920.1 hypothetical protein DMB66_45480 [Actinoplanes sp. ATCC 53533]
MVAATFLLGTGAAEAAGATKEVAFKNAFGDCNVGATVGATTDSFAIINFPSNGTVSATIKLKKLDANTTYQVRLVQTPNGLGGNCGAVDTTLTTNSQGNGTTHWSEARDTTTTGVFVLLEGGTQGFLATDGVLDS